MIPTYNGRGLLDTCLASIARHRPPIPAIAIEVVVADDASTDGTADWLAERLPERRASSARVKRRLLRRRQRRHRRRPRPIHPAAQ